MFEDSFGHGGNYTILLGLSFFPCGGGEGVGM